MTTTYELISQACPQIGAIGPAFYFTADTRSVGNDHGLDEFGFYFLGRGGVLGDVEPPVITSAFGYFHPDLVATMWNSARERTELSPREAGRLYLHCCQDFGRKHFATVPGLEAFCQAAGQVNDAAEVAGFALYAGLSAEPLAADLPARAMQLVSVLREFRGGAHLLAILATAGIDPVTAHGIRRPDFWTFFGHPEGSCPEGTPGQREALATADELTDRLVAPAFDVLDEQGRGALLGGLAGMAQAMPGRAG